MRKVEWLLFIVGIGVFAGSCVNDDVPSAKESLQAEIIDGKYELWNLVHKGEVINLYCGIDSFAIKPQYNWYEWKNGVETALQGQINNFYKLDWNEKEAIRVIKCKESYINEADSLVVKEYPFYVACTGLPTVYVTTDNEQPIVSREEKVPGTFKLNGGGQV